MDWKEFYKDDTALSSGQCGNVYLSQYLADRPVTGKCRSDGTWLDE